MKSFFRSEVKSCIGVFLQQDAVYYSFMSRGENNRLHMLHTDSCRLFLEEKEEYPTRFKHIEQFAEELAVRCTENGIKEKRAVLCIPASMIFSYQKKFPVLTEKELSSAMHWEIEANTPFAAHVYTYRRQEENIYSIGILEQSFMEEIYSAFSGNGFNIAAIVGEAEFLPEEQGQDMIWSGETVSLPAFFSWEKMGEEKELLQQAFYAAWRVIRGLPENENFLPRDRQEGAWDWRKTAACAILPFFAAAAVLYGMGEWKLSRIEKEKKAVRQELMLRADEQEIHQDFIKKKKDIKSSYALLKELRDKRISWYAVFTCLGARTLPGVTLDGIETDDNNKIRIKGNAESYEAVSEYINMWTESPVIIKESPKLETVEAGKDGSIRFSLTMKF